MTGVARLQRLTRAQGEIVKALEARITEQERLAAAFSVACTELSRLASTAGVAGLAFLPVALRKLARAEADLSAVQMRLEEFRKELLSAKHREKALETRARLLRGAIERKLVEEEALETTLIMAAKASGKHDVIS